MDTVSKKKSNAVTEDLFGDDVFVEEDLIKDTSAPAAKPQVGMKKLASEPSTRTTPKVSVAEQKRLSPEKLSERFEAAVKYMEPRIGRRPTVTHPVVRKRAFLTLLDLARSEEHLRKIMELIPRFQEARGELHSDFAVDFTRKSLVDFCSQHLVSMFEFPQVAVKSSTALSSHLNYSVTLPNTTCVSTLRPGNGLSTRFMSFIPWSTSSLRRVCLLRTTSLPSPKTCQLHQWLLLHATSMARPKLLMSPIHCSLISGK